MMKLYKNSRFFLNFVKANGFFKCGFALGRVGRSHRRHAHFVKACNDEW